MNEQRVSLSAVLASIRPVVRRDPWSEAAALLTALGVVMGVLALLPLLTPGPVGWRRGVAVMTGVVMVGLAGRLWIVGILPGLAMFAGALAAGAGAVRALLRPPASALPGADGQGAPGSGEPQAER